MWLPRVVHPASQMVIVTTKAATFAYKLALMNKANFELVSSYEKAWNMDPSIADFLRRLNSLFVNLRQDFTANHLQHIVQIFLFHEGVKPGVLMDVEWREDLRTLYTAFIDPLQELLGSEARVITEECDLPPDYSEDSDEESTDGASNEESDESDEGARVRVVSLWILTKEIIDVTLQRSLDHFHNELPSRTIPSSIWWKLLGYPTNCGPYDPCPVVIRYSVRFSPSFKSLVEFSDPLQDTKSGACVHSYGIQPDAFQSRRDAFEEEARRICASLAKLGSSRYSVDMLWSAQNF